MTDDPLVRLFQGHEAQLLAALTGLEIHEVETLENENKPYAPLGFMFSGQGEVDRFCAERDKIFAKPETQVLFERVRAYETLSYTDLYETYNLLEALEKSLGSIRPRLVEWPPPLPIFNDALLALQAKIERDGWPLYLALYTSFLVDGEDAVLPRGQPLGDLPYTAPHTIYGWTVDYFRTILSRHWRWDMQQDRESFMETYDEEACTSWAKMDAQGVPFNSSSWRAKDDDAYQLTRRENGEALFELPFPHPFIWWCLQKGCWERTESVAFIAAWGYLFQRLIHRVKNVLAWRLGQRWRVYRRKRAARFISEAIWFAYYKAEGFYPNRILPLLRYRRAAGMGSS
jgi:hypothetical protein